MRRRAFLAGGLALAGGAGLGRAGRRRATVDREPAGTILSGAEHETPVYVLEGSDDGPTGLVVGGIHGDERSGYLAAERLLDWSLAAGRLVVLPRAHRAAIERGTRRGAGGDLNRQFPPGRDPPTELARAVWSLVERHDPDVVADLHSSTGIYGVHAEFVGQAVFPTEAGDAPSHAASVVEAANEQVVPWYMPLHDYRVGNVLSGTAPLLVHKVGGDLGVPGYIVETTEFLVDPRTAAGWTVDVAEALLARHGLEREGDR